MCVSSIIPDVHRVHTLPSQQCKSQSSEVQRTEYEIVLCYDGEKFHCERNLL